MHEFFLFLFILPVPPILGGMEKIDPPLLQKIEAAGDTASSDGKGTFNIVVRFNTPSNLEQERTAAISQLKNNSDRALKTYEIMSEISRSSQESIIKSITKLGKNAVKMKNIRQLWCMNMLSVKSVSGGLIKSLGEDKPENANVTLVYEDFEMKVVSGSNNHQQRKANWSVEKIRADLWTQQGYNGSGVIVGHISTGVDNQPDLNDSWIGREGGGWLDPSGVYKEPGDPSPYAVGTHSLGIIVGKKIGIAPGSRWISCIGTPTQTGMGAWSNYLECGCHMICPNPEGDGTEDTGCSNRPSVVFGGIGFPQGSSNTPNFTKEFDNIIELWRSIGIIPVFPAGGEGTNGCDSIVTPADHKDVITVGATDETGDVLANYSSRGPPSQRYTRSEYESLSIYKPDVLAPGTDIMAPAGGGVYQWRSGTEQAAAHVVGIIALILSRSPTASFDQIRTCLHELAKRAPKVELEGPQKQCGSKDDDVIPNHKVGYGMVELKDPDDSVFPPATVLRSGAATSYKTSLCLIMSILIRFLFVFYSKIRQS